MFTVEKTEKLLKLARDMEEGKGLSLILYQEFLVMHKTLSDCLEIQSERAKKYLLDNGFTGEGFFPEYDRKVVYSDGKITISFVDENIYTALKKKKMEKLFLDIAKVQKTKVDNTENKELREICMKNSNSEKGNPYISVVKLSKKDKVNS
jgi:hypothetical protein